MIYGMMDGIDLPHGLGKKEMLEVSENLRDAMLDPVGNTPRTVSVIAGWAIGVNTMGGSCMDLSVWYKTEEQAERAAKKRYRPGEGSGPTVFPVTVIRFSDTEAIIVPVHCGCLAAYDDSFERRDQAIKKLKKTMSEEEIQLLGLGDML